MYDDVTKIACHKDATTGAKVASVKAGGKVDITWNTWPESHVGPVIDYMAKVDDATATTAKDLNFFKVAEAGYENGEWAAVKLIKNDLTWSVTVPESIAPGDYVLRHEIIALHSAGQENGAQNYPKCMNLKVEGSGTATPEGVTADKLYTASDPGLKVNVYSGDMSSYKIPGPALFSGASSGSSSSGNGTSAAAPAASKSAASTPAASSAPALQDKAVETPAASATSAPATSAQASSAPASTGSSSSGEKEFTLDTFIAWLQKEAGSESSSSSKTRRHPRAFRN